MNKELCNSFGIRVRDLRRSLNLSQEDLAEAADLHRTYIGMIERGEKNATLTSIDRIAKALNVKISDLTD